MEREIPSHLGHELETGKYDLRLTFTRDMLSIRTRKSARSPTKASPILGREEMTRGEGAVEGAVTAFGTEAWATGTHQAGLWDIHLTHLQLRDHRALFLLTFYFHLGGEGHFTLSYPPEW